MKNFKLFKRLGAFITAIAVLASMGTVAFADVAPQVAINNVNCVDPDNDGIYEVTVAYTVSGAAVGDKGITLLAYGAAKENAPLEDGENFTEYKDGDYKIAYVFQATKEPAELVEDGKAPQSYVSEGDHTISFNIDTRVEGAIKVGEGEKILVLLGGDKVTTPDAKLYPIPVVIDLKANGEVITEFGSIDVDLGTETIEEALKAELAGNAAYVYVDGEPAEWDDVTVAVEETTEGDYAYKATLTVAAGSTYVYFNADLSWKATALEVSGAPYTIAAANIEGEVTADALEAAVKTEVLKTVKAINGDLKVAIADADAITVELVNDAFNPAEPAELTFTVTLVADTYADGDIDVIVESALTETVTVNYQLEAAPAGLLGDVNGDEEVDGSDVLDLQAYAVWGTEIPRLDLADVNSDNEVDGSDVLDLQAYAVWGTEFPQP